ncbi:TPA: LysR family transcriptional regulator [Pluralibacter gergoviae]|uniref:LysR family transcriptional regulator n=1 Tax=Pluralibacter gergoviae TaxID=61647 RepID=A0A0J5MSL3_PLUGE|nr:LysR family transcriptional regulator [Pluralibacter gergoviae]EKV6249587.1 LysR family transcriptional regulator [Pluralibacter gergoviae]ELD4300744.1 LysR family transcriptional regulator [Pluralibacter gergoviae]ELN2737884.1 LysR family transcriptional regulator [Pluralibacter gergoviae]KMK14652.1 LysR family transcriptional regulator [Pluralibacter gergoviae]KMK26526.1 LysR family transcriptional regulator [Pluralibacter gergoviae]
MNFSSDNIELFLAVLDRGSFSAAARALRRVPSAVSMGIANMEAELGFDLFDRSRREPVPTPLALALAPHARAIAAQLKQLQIHAVELSQGLESTLSVGVAADINSAALLAAIRRLSERYSLLNVELLSAPRDDVLHMLHEQRIALGLVFGGLSVNSAEQLQLVGSDALVATLSPAHPAWRQTDGGLFIEDLVNVRQIVVASRDLPVSDQRPQVAAFFWQTDSLTAALSMVEAGLGWGNFPLSLTQPLLDSGRLVRLRFKNTHNALRLPMHLVWLKNRPLDRAARELVDLMQQSAGPA